MGILYLGLASFAFYVRKKGYELQFPSATGITFWPIIPNKKNNKEPLKENIDDVYASFQIKAIKEYKCGCVTTTNKNVLIKRFQDENFANFLCASCKRNCSSIEDKETNLNIKEISHCPIYNNEILKGNIPTDIRNDKPVNCQQEPNIFAPTHKVKTLTNNGKMSLRKAPYRDLDSFIKIDDGIEIQCLDIGEKIRHENIFAPWYFIKTEDNIYGWCFSGNLEELSICK